MERMERGYLKIPQTEFAARVRAARAYADVSMQDFAKETGITRQALSRREAGTVRMGPEARTYMVQTLMRLSGLPEEFFSVPDLNRPFLESPSDEVSPSEVVRRLEDGPDEDVLGSK